MCMEEEILGDELTVSRQRRKFCRNYDAAQLSAAFRLDVGMFWNGYVCVHSMIDRKSVV